MEFDHKNLTNSLLQNFAIFSEAKFLDGLRWAGGIDSCNEKEPSMESITNIYPRPYCKLAKPLKNSDKSYI
jgi:hypothetical protein